MKNFNEQLSENIRQIDAALDQYLPKQDTYPSMIHEAMRYSVFAGGKRLRPILLLEACRCCGGAVDVAMPFACAVEFIHTYSLIHDDLPAMDNDDYRRGKLTNHKVYGEGMAILAGDALLHSAVELMSDVCLNPDISPDIRLKIIHEVMVGAGTMGMIGGQVVDLSEEGKKTSADTLKYIHAHKTGALIRISLLAGARCGGASLEALEHMKAFGNHIGLAFQIVDDILDVVGDEKKLGKQVGSDEKNQKATYPALYGMQASKEMAQKALNDALKSLESWGEEGEFLRSLAKYMVIRDY